MRQGVLALIVVGCAAPAVGTQAEPITNGSNDAGDPAVVALVDASGGVLCTASVIGPHTGITAAHCFSGPPARTLRVFFGTDVASGGTFAPVSDARQHPGFDPGTFAHDVAVFTFRDASPVPPLALDARTIDTSLVGMTFEAVGYGSTGSAADTGIKRAGVAQISDVQADELATVQDPSQPCSGDSGGPMLLAPDAVTAVVSHGDAACTDHAIYARIDVARAPLVDPYVAATAPGAAHTGDACFYDGHCAEGPCLQTTDDPLLYFCSRACTHDSDCPAALECAAKQCRYPEPSPGALGSRCSRDSDCTGAMCRDQVCTINCLGMPDVCPAGYECRGQDLSQFCMAAPAGCGGCGTGETAPMWVLAACLVAVIRRLCRSDSIRHRW